MPSRRFFIQPPKITDSGFETIAMRRLLLAAVLILPALSSAAVPDAAREQELLRMVRQDCGSCHGMTLKGGLGPALTPEALQARGLARETIVATILGGRPGTPMPPWRPFLSEDEAGWIADRLRAGLPQ